MNNQVSIVKQMSAKLNKNLKITNSNTTFFLSISNITPFFIIDENKNVGIGTSNPVVQLDVSGNVNISGLLNVSSISCDTLQLNTSNSSFSLSNATITSLNVSTFTGVNATITNLNISGNSTFLNLFASNATMNNITISTINVTGSSTFVNINTSNATMNNVTMSNLNVLSNATFNNLNVSSINIGNTLLYQIGIPKITDGNWSTTTLTKFQNYLNGINQSSPKYIKLNKMTVDSSNITSLGYSGAIYSPNQKRVYFVPFMQYYQTNWHYVDCLSNKLISYAKNVTTQSGTVGAYVGACYAPTLDRIYFMPYGNSTNATWHFIDCKTGNVSAYAHSISSTTTLSFYGGVYSPVNDRIYLITQFFTSTTWYYIDGRTGNVSSYNSGNNGILQGYGGGCYAPTLNRIYMSPQSTNTTITTNINWQYIDCSTDQIVDYSVPDMNQNSAYDGISYSPTQNRLYFVPSQKNTTWHYIDGSNGSIVGYSASSTTSFAYTGGVYSPAHNRIYFIPNAQSSNTTWHYIDCSNGSVVEYARNFTGIGGSQFFYGGCYNPILNKIHLSVHSNSDSTFWYYLDELDNVNISSHIMSSSALFNKY